MAKKQNTMLLIGVAAAAALGYFLLRKKRGADILEEGQDMELSTGRKASVEVGPLEKMTEEEFMTPPSGGLERGAQSLKRAAATASEAVELAEGTVSTAVKSLKRSPEAKAAAAKRRAERKAKAKAAAAARKEKKVARRKKRAAQNLGELNFI